MITDTPANSNNMSQGNHNLEKLKQVFSQYAEVCRGNLGRGSRGKEKDPTEGQIVAVPIGTAMELRALVEKLEKMSIFKELVQETHFVFSGRNRSKSEYAEFTWRQPVENFFRNTGFYIDLFEGKTPEIEANFDRYSQALTMQKTQRRYLAPMEYVQFAEECMDLGEFRICRFQGGNLNTILRNRINQVFYPWASIETGNLQNYWFVDVTETVPAHKWGHIDVDWTKLEQVSISYTRYPRPLELVFRQLSLFDWQPSWLEASDSDSQDKEGDLKRGWLGFSIPFILTVDDSLLNSPARAPEISHLDLEPVFDQQNEEEIGARPNVFIHLDQKETDSFKAFMLRISEFSSAFQKRQNEWRFLDIAWDYLLKAFLTPDSLEQLLWHVVVLEALFGERRQPVASRLPLRIASLFGESKEEKKAIKDQINELYDFRSSLVHGSYIRETIYVGHLRHARNLARRTVLWFLNYLNYTQVAQTEDRTNQDTPTREDILTLLDLDQKSRIRVGSLVQRLPDGFPKIQGWIQ